MLLLASACADSQQLPAGWRLPSDRDLSDEARSDSAVKYARAAADFNGDGIEDQVLLLKAEKGNFEALWVWLSDSRRGHRWIRLDQIRWPKQYSDVALAMGVNVQPPGQLIYACYDTDKVCNFDSYEKRPKMELRYSAILYFKLESAASLYYWSSKRKKFIRVWLSD
jgi:hypothetical protein